MLVFGWIGGILSNIYNIPQIYHTYKIKSTKDLSLLSIFVRLFSYTFYIIHAIIISDPPLLWNTIVSQIQVIIILIQYLIYNKNKLENDKIKNDKIKNDKIEEIL